MAGTTSYVATVEYYITNNFGETIGTLREDFFVTAKNPQYVKEKYHRFSHENYENVSRSEELSHVHPVGENGFGHSLVEIRRATESDRNLTSIRRM